MTSLRAFLHNALDTPILRAAMQEFAIITKNIKRAGTTGKVQNEEGLPCQCEYTPGKDHPSEACGVNSNCINRTLFVECEDDCPSGSYCQNQSFRKQEYAPLQIIDAGPKGRGLAAMSKLAKETFVMEYVGELLPRDMFLKRMEEHLEGGPGRKRHYYFMAVSPHEILDASRKGNFARFLNHSCEPNCQLQKWVVGNELRMGIFTTREVSADEELCFDYKIDRYGAESQKCLCGTPSCTGWIGGGKGAPLNESDYASDEEELQTLFNDAPIVAKENRPPKRVKPLTNLTQVQSLARSILHSNSQHGSARKHNCVERILLTDDPLLLRSFQRFHGLSILKTCMNECPSNDEDFLASVLQAFAKIPVSTKNTIDDNGLFQEIFPLQSSTNSEIAALATQLHKTWSGLHQVYRIPKAKRLAGVSMKEPLDTIIEHPKIHKTYEVKPKTDEMITYIETKKVPVETELPPDWSSTVDKKTGDIYYYNSKTQASTWTRPVLGSPPYDHKVKIDSNDWAAVEAAKAKSLRVLFGEEVVKRISLYKRKISHGQFKESARAITHALTAKEVKSQLQIDLNPHRIVVEMTDDKRKMTAKYVDAQIKKLGITPPSERKPSKVHRSRPKEL